MTTITSVGLALAALHERIAAENVLADGAQQQVLAALLDASQSLTAAQAAVQDAVTLINHTFGERKAGLLLALGGEEPTSDDIGEGPDGP